MKRPKTKGLGPGPGGREAFRDAVEETLQDERYSARAVFERIKEALGCDSDSELAWILGVSSQTISDRKRRNSAPYREAIYVAAWAKVSLEYLLTGHGTLGRPPN